MKSECREAFERNECEKYETNYDDMKNNWDWYESQYGWRYPDDSPRGQEWKAWEKSWQHQQSKVDELTKQRDSFIKAYEIEMNKSVELQKRVDVALQLVNEMKGKRYPFSAYADQLEQALKGGGE